MFNKYKLIAITIIVLVFIGLISTGDISNIAVADELVLGGPL